MSRNLSMFLVERKRKVLKRLEVLVGPGLDRAVVGAAEALWIRQWVDEKMGNVQHAAQECKRIREEMEKIGCDKIDGRDLRRVLIKAETMLEEFL